MYEINEYIQDIFSECFDNLRGTGTVTNVTDNTDGTYTITTDNTDYISVGYYVDLTVTGISASYKVLSIVDGVSFNIKCSLAISDTTGTWKSQAWYYTPALSIEITTKITKEQQDIDKDVVPRGWLVEGFDWNVSDERADYVIPSLTLVLFNATEQENTTEERYTNNYKTVIDPFFNRLMTELADHHNILEPRNGFDLSFENSQLYNNKTNKNQFSIFTDAKIITIRNLQIINTNCNE